MIFECLIQNFPKLTTLPTVQGATSKGASTGASSSKSARASKSPPVPAPAPAATRGKGKAPATTPMAPAPAAKGVKAMAPAPAAKGVKATGPKTVPAAAPEPAPTPTPAPAPAPAPAAPDNTKCCFFNTYKSHWQPHLPILGCDGDPSGLRTCLSGKILNDTDDMR